MRTQSIHSIRFITLAFATAAMLLGACKKEDAGATEPVPEQPSAAQAQDRPPSSLSAQARASINQTLAAYDRIHAKLARDEVTGVTEDADAAQRAATSAASDAPEALRPQLATVAAAAGRLKDMPKDDADAVRRTFGDLSSAAVALLAAEPSLQQGRHLFECPLAQGYKKWVQASAEISNPYMGTRMPECGSESGWQ